MGSILVELSNIIATQVRLTGISQEQGARLLAEAQALMPELSHVPHSKALEAAIQFGISAYDARFVALAMHIKPDWTVSLAGVG